MCCPFAFRTKSNTDMLIVLFALLQYIDTEYSFLCSFEVNIVLVLTIERNVVVRTLVVEHDNFCLSRNESLSQSDDNFIRAILFLSRSMLHQSCFVYPYDICLITSFLLVT